MTRGSLVVVVLAASLAGCPKDDPPKPDATTATGPSVTASTPIAPASASASAGPAKQEAASYEGKYTATPSTLFIPSENKDYTGVKQAKDDETKMVGEGTVSLTVDGTGRVAGAIDSGPVAPAIVDGVVSDGVLSGTVRRKDATDNGLHGTIAGKVASDGVEATMKLSDANAGILREAKASLKKK